MDKKDIFHNYIKESYQLKGEGIFVGAAILAGQQ